MIPRDLKKKVRLLENGSGHYSVQSVPDIIIIIIIIKNVKIRVTLS